MQKRSIGEKVLYFRKRGGLSQLELETAINASPGSISRIESGKVNPTKETLLAIANTLNLTLLERNELFDLIGLFASKAEIASAVEESKDYLSKPGVLAYLIDEWVNLHAVSATMLSFFNLTKEQFDKHLAGKNFYEIIFNPDYNIKQFIDPESFANSLANEISRTKYEIDLPTYMPELFNRLIKYPGFAKIWEESDKNIDRVMSPISKQAHFIKNGQKIHLYFSREKLKANPRFELIEYFQPEAK